jgi:hypothetical protein
VTLKPFEDSELTGALRRVQHAPEQPVTVLDRSADDDPAVVQVREKRCLVVDIRWSSRPADA